MPLRKKKVQLSPPVLIAGSFLLLILFGTLLLKLQISAEQEPLSWADALFTATSAATVTGLSVFDLGTTLSLFGEIVLLVLIQLGGLGLMALAVGILMVLRKKVGYKNRMYIQESFNRDAVGGVIKLIRSILFFAGITEGSAVIILTLHWLPEFGFEKAFYYSVFHVISAFNNAGFSLFPQNLVGMAEDPIISSVISLLYISGGIGFVVILDLVQSKTAKQWSLHTKMMVSGTLILNIFATIILFMLEYNPHTLGSLSLPGKIMASFFQATSPRTAGFNTIDIGAMEDPSLLFTMLLMFIGAGSTSTASGIKLTTFIVVMLATLSFLRGSQEAVLRSLAITTISFMTVVWFLFLLTVTETIALMPLAFEVVSAFGTVGLSTGITGSLSDLGELIICAVMFIGHIGPLTLFFMLVKRQRPHYRHPYDNVYTG